MYWDWREELYFIFGFISIAPLALATDLLNSKKFYHYCVAISIPWFLLGTALAYKDTLELDNVLLVGIFAFPAIHLLTFEVLRRFFFKVTCKNPLVTEISSIRSGKAIKGLFSKTATRRRLRPSDFYFTILEILVPFAIVFGTWILFFK